MPEIPKTFAEFFAGIGLVRMGLSKGGWEVNFANDIDVTKRRQYEYHFTDSPSHFHLGDIHQLETDSIPTVTLATASFPCTDLSLAGRRVGLDGEHSSAFWGFVNILENLKDRKPPIIMLENVVGFLTSKGGADFHEALTALQKIGYSLDAIVVDASRFVPQSRVRLFLIGHLGGLFSSSQMQASLAASNDPLRPQSLLNFIDQHPEINWSIKPLKELPKNSYKIDSIVEKIPENSSYWWNEERTSYFLAQISDKHNVAMKPLLHQENDNFLTAFRRVRNGKSMAEIRFDGIAGCLRTPKGGSARQILVRIGKGQIKVRFLLPIECARLMGANDFRISGTFNESLFGFGDAVCVPVIEWIEANYLEPLRIELEKRLLQQTKHHERLVAEAII